MLKISFSPDFLRLPFLKLSPFPADKYLDNFPNQLEIREQKTVMRIWNNKKVTF